MPKRKPKTTAALVNDAAVLLQKLVRMKAALAQGDYISCVTCGVKKHWKEMQGGHFISRRFTKYKVDEENIHPQCPACNGPRQGNIQAYTLFMIDMYGRKKVNEMVETKHETRKYSRIEAVELIQYLKEQIKIIGNQL